MPEDVDWADWIFREEDKLNREREEKSLNKKRNKKNETIK